MECDDELEGHLNQNGKAAEQEKTIKELQRVDVPQDGAALHGRPTDG